MNLIYDTIGIGFGPANIAVACAMEELNFNHTTLFLEKNAGVEWQKNMMFKDSDIQNNPLRDLVTPRNPRSKYSFTNFLHVKGRLFEHLNLGMAFPFREEYSQYISWVASHFEDKVKFNTHVENIDIITKDGEKLYKIIDADATTYLSRSIILAPGRTPNIPAEFTSIKSERVIFLTNYLKGIESFKNKDLKNVAVVGGSQSAIEILLHLSTNYPKANLHGITRRFGYLQKDVNPFTGEVYFPEFVDLFFNATKETKERLLKDLHLTNYSSSDYDVLDKLYKRIYLQKIKGESQILIHRCSDITEVKNHDSKIELTFKKAEEKHLLSESFDLVILATGFKNTGTSKNAEKFHPLLKKIAPYLKIDEENCSLISYDYSLDLKNIDAPFFMNGLCESSHGMGDAGSFSLLALRSECIVKSLEKKLEQVKLSVSL